MDGSQICLRIAKLKPLVEDEDARREFMEIKYQNKVRLDEIYQRA